MKRLQAYGLEVKAAATAVDTELADAALTGKPKPKQASRQRQEEGGAAAARAHRRRLRPPGAARPAAGRQRRRARRAEAGRRQRRTATRAQAPDALLAAGRARPRLRRRRAPRRHRLAGRAPHGSRRRSRRPRRRPAAPPAAPRWTPAPRHLHGADAAGRLVLKADTIRVNSGSTVKDVAEYLGVAVPEIIKKLMTPGRDGDAHADAVRRRDPGDRGRVRQGDRDRPRLRGGRRRARVRGHRRRARRSARRS